MSDDPRKLATDALALAEKATPGDWLSVLGSGEHQCTAIIAEFEPPRASIFIADLLPDWALAEMVVPDDHIPNLKFLAASRALVPALARALLVALDEVAAVKALVARSIVEIAACPAYPDTDLLKDLRASLESSGNSGEVKQ